MVISIVRYDQCKSPANSFLNGGRVIASVSTLERLLFLMQESRNVSFAFFWMILIIWMNDTILIPKWLQRDCINVGLPIWPFGFYHVWSQSQTLLFFFEIFLKMVGKIKYWAAQVNKNNLIMYRFLTKLYLGSNETFPIHLWALWCKNFVSSHIRAIRCSWTCAVQNRLQFCKRRALVNIAYKLWKRNISRLYMYVPHV